MLTKRERALLQKYRAVFGDVRPSTITQWEAVVGARTTGRPKKHWAGRDEQVYLVVELVRYRQGSTGRDGVTKAQRQCARFWHVSKHVVAKAYRRARKHVLSEPDVAYLNGLPSYQRLLKKIAAAKTPRK
jgi:hypothetical protein